MSMPSEPSSSRRARSEFFICSISTGVVSQSPIVGATRSPVRASTSDTRTHPRSRTNRSIVRSGAATDAFSTGSMSRISPPPIVSSRPDSRSTYRSPGSSGRASGRNNRTAPVAPGTSRSAPRTRIVTGYSPDPMYARKAPRRETSWSNAASTVNDASTRSVSRQRSGSITPFPRSIAPWSIPARLSATRSPGPMESTARPARWIDRTRTSAPPGCDDHPLIDAHGTVGQACR